MDDDKIIEENIKKYNRSFNIKAFKQSNTKFYNAIISSMKDVENISKQKKISS